MAAFCTCCGAVITTKAERCLMCGAPRHGMTAPEPANVPFADQAVDEQHPDDQQEVA